MSAIDQFLLHWSTYTRFDTLLIGAWLALWLRGANPSAWRLKRLGLLLLAVPIFLLFVYCLLRLHELNTSSVLADPFIDTFGYTLIALASAGLLLLSLDESTRLSRVLQWRPLAFLGTISYGFYFFHALPQTLLQRATDIRYPQLRFAVPFIAFAFTVSIATLSFHFYEAPFLKLKARFAPGHKSVPSGREELDLKEVI
jgi:peptidoglycan/LPS O-acetylase OafA/YrhL